jgi:carbonic anhydrase
MPLSPSIPQPGTCTTSDFNYTLSGHVIQATYLTDNCTAPRMIIPGQPNPFEAVQFHMHTGSDHAIDGVYFGADMHLVHKEVGGDRFSVLGLFIEPTSPSDTPTFGDLLVGWETAATSTTQTCSVSNATTNSNVTVQSTSNGTRLLRALENRGRELAAFNYYDLIPEGATMYQYNGSLTTPPCSEVVFWNVVDKPIQVSVREYLKLTSLVIDYRDPATCALASIAAPSGFTGRPVNPINGRKINRVCPTALKGVLPTVGQQASASASSSSGAAASVMGATMTVGVALVAMSSFLLV